MEVRASADGLARPPLPEAHTPIGAASSADLAGRGVSLDMFGCLRMAATGTPYAAPGAVTSVHHDIWEELMWTGSEDGLVQSYLGSTLQRYVSFPAHRGAVRRILSVDRGVASCGGDSVAFRRRGGAGVWSTRLPTALGINDMAFCGSLSELAVATQAAQLVTVNLYRGSIMRQGGVGSPITRLCRTAFRAVVCGTASGGLELRDQRMLQTTGCGSTVAHAGVVADLDAHQHLVASTGALVGGGCEPEALVFDVRRLGAPLLRLPFPGGGEAQFVRFNPQRLGGALLAVGSALGGLALFDASTGASLCGDEAGLAVDPSCYVSALDVSSSGDLYGLGTTSGLVYQWGEVGPELGSVNAQSRRTAGVAPPSEPPAHFDADDGHVPLSSVGMPAYQDRLFSAFERPTWHRWAPAAPRIPQDVLATVKMVDFVGYVNNPNPSQYRRNQSYPLSARIERAQNAGQRDVPKFRSQQERETLGSRGSTGATATSRGTPQVLTHGSTLSHATNLPLQAPAEAPSPITPPDAAAASGTALRRLPKHYRKVEIKYSKYGVDDFDFGYYNHTRFAGLEPVAAPTAYVNALLQILRFVEPLCVTLVAHCRGSCLVPTCLACEMGFLFQMMADAGGVNCLPANLLKVFSGIPQAVALGLLDPETSPNAVVYAQVVQKCGRFVLERLHQELSAPTDASGGLFGASVAHSETAGNAVRQVFGASMRVATSCVCGHETSRATEAFSVDLLYGKRPHSGGAGASFGYALTQSANRLITTKAWCTQCRRYNAITQSRRLASLPRVLHVNPGDVASTPGSSALASGGTGSRDVPADSGAAANSADVVNTGDSGAAAGNGDAAAPGPTGAPAGDAEAAAAVWWRLAGQWAASGRRDASAEAFLPFVLCATVNKDGSVTFTDGERPDATFVYDLTATVAQVHTDAEPRHLVAHVRTASTEGEEWHVFNDFLVQRVDAAEAVTFRIGKVPALLQYTRRDATSSFARGRVPEIDAPDRSLLLHDSTVLNPYTHIERTAQPLAPQEIPRGRQMLVAIDSEFVCTAREEKELRSGRMHQIVRPTQYSLARLSVVRAEGPHAGVPLIDDYIGIQEPVIDYLSEFSGIQPADIDPHRSAHAVVPLKTIAKKMRCLIDLGCKFIGHGLYNDFRTMNVVVPRENVIDTLELFFIKSRHRRIGLKFLAWYLLKQDIQTNTHDSIEDARATLQVYRKYEELQRLGIFDEVLQDIYRVGQSVSWRPAFPNTVRTRMDELLGELQLAGSSAVQAPSSAEGLDSTAESSAAPAGPISFAAAAGSRRAEVSANGSFGALGALAASGSMTSSGPPEPAVQAPARNPQGSQGSAGSSRRAPSGVRLQPRGRRAVTIRPAAP